MNAPDTFEITGNILTLIVGEKQDFFINPVDSSITNNAPFLYRKVSGDFVATALVKPGFSSVWDAAALMVYQDSTHWIKLAFEDSDATGKSIVSVVTDGISDDANGPILHQVDSVWLRIIRKNNVYALHWSIDGNDFRMVRIAALPDFDLVMIGLEAQCPAGQSTTHEFHYFSIEQKTVKDLRKGV
jgi:regulation of enolase protein 1 (concanavalin A-like superfamily)